MHNAYSAGSGTAVINGKLPIRDFSDTAKGPTRISLFVEVVNGYCQIDNRAKPTMLRQVTFLYDQTSDEEILSKIRALGNGDDVAWDGGVEGQQPNWGENGERRGTLSIVVNLKESAMIQGSEKALADATPAGVGV